LAEMKEITNCPICKNKHCREIFKRRLEYPEGELTGDFSDFNFVRNKILFDRILHEKKAIDFVFKICTNCGFIFFSPRCEKEDYEEKFAAKNELGIDRILEKKQYGSDNELYSETYEDKRALMIYKRLSRIRKIENSTVIDIGGARGLNFKYFLPHNLCYVVDYVEHDLLRGVKYLCKSSQHIPEFIKADVVLFCHTLEHVLDPVEEINNIKKVLKPNGLLYIEVPPGCWKQEYKNIRNFITHINFFSEGSLQYLLDMCGLKIKSLKLKPLISRTRYEPIIMAIAEKTTAKNKNVNGYHITQKQMKGIHLFLRLYTNFMSLRLMKLKYFKWLLMRIENATKVSVSPKN
jgi:SAM-dependent methyltransferase